MLYYKDELDGLCQAGQMNVQVAFSREKARYENGAFVADNPQRVDKLMLNEANMGLLWQLMRPKAQNGLEAYFYICGPAELLLSIRQVFEQVIQKYMGADDPDLAAEYFYQLNGQGRFQTDTFTSFKPQLKDPTDLTADDYHTVSELVGHNTHDAGYWMIIDKNVYDLTPYLKLHPGGTHLIMFNAGRDGTQEFNQVSAHINTQETKSALSAYFLRPLQVIDFKNTAKEQCFQATVNFLFQVVEAQNMLNIDFTLEDKDMGNLFMIRESINAHRRFIGKTLAALIYEASGYIGAISALSPCPRQAQKLEALGQALSKLSQSEGVDFPFALDAYEDIMAYQS